MKLTHVLCLATMALACSSCLTANQWKYGIIPGHKIDKLEQQLNGTDKKSGGSDNKSRSNDLNSWQPLPHDTENNPLI